MTSVEEHISIATEVLNQYSANNATLSDAIASVHRLVQCVQQLGDECAQPSAASDRTTLLCGALQQLRRSCTFGVDVQLALASVTDIDEILHPLLIVQHIEFAQPSKFAWQMLVNVCAGNTDSQRLVWTAHKTTLHAVLAQPTHRFAELCRMIVYMLLLNDIFDVAESKTILKHITHHYREVVESRATTIPEYLQFCLEHYCGRRRGVLPLYGSLDDHERVAFLQFCVDYVGRPAGYDEADQPAAAVSAELVQYLCKEFKKKSDCVLKTESSYVDAIHPREVYALLEVISKLSGDAAFAHIFAPDSALFLNVGCLLAGISALGQRSGSVFTPVSKLGQIAPNSLESAAIERDISYDLKSMLVRTLANLAYRNARNQELAREMDILLAVMNCTSVDARNPLIKEWSVLAIRNLCDGCDENQAIVKGLMKVGDADNSAVLKEFNLEMGSLRIGGENK